MTRDLELRGGGDLDLDLRGDGERDLHLVCPSLLLLFLPLLSQDLLPLSDGDWACLPSDFLRGLDVAPLVVSD